MLSYIAQYERPDSREHHALTCKSLCKSSEDDVLVMIFLVCNKRPNLTDVEFHGDSPSIAVDIMHEPFRSEEAAGQCISIK